MLCPDCHGKGGFLPRHLQDSWTYFQCRTCRGAGIIHCCDGEVSQPDVSSVQPQQSTTADQQTRPPAPTSEVI